MDDAQNPEPEVDAGPPPIVVDLGKVKRRHATALRDGDGPLLDEVEQVVDAVRKSVGEEVDGAKILPVVVLYRVKPKRKKRPSSWGW